MHFLQRALHPLQVGGIAALGGDRRGLGFDPQTHLEHLRQVRQAAIALGETEHGAGGGLGNVRTQATPGDQYAVGLELGDGLANHRAADVQLLGQLLLGRQARFGGQAAGVDLGADRIDHAHNERVGSLEFKHGWVKPW